ncbi:MAG: hypothetical protein GWN16_07750, partial [Calditrichae bacterium]|nr:hypothetical protein [Calditrichia bacterium]
MQDSNGIDDLKELILTLRKGGTLITTYPDTLELITSPAPDTVLFGAFFDSSFAAERIGDYELEFQAVDLSDDSSQILAKAIYL